MLTLLPALCVGSLPPDLLQSSTYFPLRSLFESQKRSKAYHAMLYCNDHMAGDQIRSYHTVLQPHQAVHTTHIPSHIIRPCQILPIESNCIIICTSHHIVSYRIVTYHSSVLLGTLSCRNVRVVCCIASHRIASYEIKSCRIILQHIASSPIICSAPLCHVQHLSSCDSNRMRVASSPRVSMPRTVTSAHACLNLGTVKVCSKAMSMLHLLHDMMQYDTI